MKKHNGMAQAVTFFTDIVGCQKAMSFGPFADDKGTFMTDLLDRAQDLGCGALVFTVDMPVPGIRYRDAHSGMSGPMAPMRRYLQSMGVNTPTQAKAI